MILGLPIESFVVQIVLPAIVIAAMFVASYRGRGRGGDRAKGDSK
ncbi:MAG: hypothetical protein OXG59_12525 [Gammaproteobacteria bacterium]|nr:hypothetical protein [Gammaproteobacteria bacterium]MDE0488448.1 hypothetical protein [Gammaproteobacteria bacterium]